MNFFLKLAIFLIVGNINLSLSVSNAFDSTDEREYLNDKECRFNGCHYNRKIIESLNNEKRALFSVSNLNRGPAFNRLASVSLRAKTTEEMPRKYYHKMCGISLNKGPEFGKLTCRLILNYIPFSDAGAFYHIDSGTTKEINTSYGEEYKMTAYIPNCPHANKKIIKIKPGSKIKVEIKGCSYKIIEEK